MGQDHDDFLEQCHTDDDDEFFLRDILQELALSSESETQSFHHTYSDIVQNQNHFTATTVAGAAAATDGGSLSSDEITGLDRPRRYVLSFDNSTIIPATAEPFHGCEQLGGHGTRSSKSNSPLSFEKRTLESQNSQPKPKTSQGGKKSRSDSQILDHIAAERKRRQELTQRFIALAATIPDLKKVIRLFFFFLVLITLINFSIHLLFCSLHILICLRYLIIILPNKESEINKYVQVFKMFYLIQAIIVEYL